MQHICSIFCLSQMNKLMLLINQMAKRGFLDIIQFILS